MPSQGSVNSRLKPGKHMRQRLERVGSAGLTLEVVHEGASVHADLRLLLSLLAAAEQVLQCTNPAQIDDVCLVACSGAPLTSHTYVRAVHGQTQHDVLFHKVLLAVYLLLCKQPVARVEQMVLVPGPLCDAAPHAKEEPCTW